MSCILPGNPSLDKISESQWSLFALADRKPQCLAAGSSLFQEIMSSLSCALCFSTLKTHAPFGWTWKPWVHLQSYFKMKKKWKIMPKTNHIKAIVALNMTFQMAYGPAPCSLSHPWSSLPCLLERIWIWRLWGKEKPHFSLLNHSKMYLYCFFWLQSSTCFL